MPEDVKPVKTDKAAEAPEAAPAEKATKAKDAAAPGAKKKDNTLKIVLIVVGVLVGLGILGTIASIVFFSSLFNAATDGVDVDGNGNGTVTVKSDSGESTATYGEGATLNDGFPDDVPIFEPSTLVASSKIDDKNYSASAKTSKSTADVLAYYKTELTNAGWENTYEATFEDSAIATYKKGTRGVNVTAGTQQDDKKENTFFTVSATDE